MAKKQMLCSFLIALCCFASALAEQYAIEGRVYCDLCRAGFYNDLTEWVPGATVRAECTDKDTGKVNHSVEATTDETGSFKISVPEDHDGEMCFLKLAKSPRQDCKEADPSNNVYNFVLHHSSGRIGSLAFFKDQPTDAKCSDLF